MLSKTKTKPLQILPKCVSRIKGQLISHRIKIYVFQVHLFGGASLYEPLLILTLCTHIRIPIFLLDTFRVRNNFYVSLTSLLLKIWQTKSLMLIPHNFFWFQQNYVKLITIKCFVTIIMFYLIFSWYLQEQKFLTQTNFIYSFHMNMQKSKFSQI